MGRATVTDLTTRQRTGRRDVLLLLAIAALVVLYWVMHLQVLEHVPSYGDEGFVAQSARRVWMGQVPYRDFFSGVTPGSFYFYAGLFKLGGANFLTMRIGVLLTCCAILAGTWWVLARCGARTFLPLAMAAGYLAYYAGPYWFVASYHWMALALSLVSLALLLAVEESRRPHLLIFAAGVLATLTAFVLQHRGGLWTIAASLALLTLPGERRWRSLAWFWAGIAAMAVPLTVSFAVAAGWGQLVDNLIMFPLTQYHKMEGHSGVVRQYLAETWKATLSTWGYRQTLTDWLRICAQNLGFVGHLVVHLLPVLGGLALLRLWRRQLLPRFKLVLLAAFFLASYLSALHRLADTTLGFAAPAAVIALILALTLPGLEGLSSQTKRWRTLAVSGWLVLFTIVPVSYAALQGASNKVTTVTAAGPVDSYLVGEAQTIEGVIGYLNEHRRPGEEVFCYPFLPLFYFLLQADNPTPYDVMVYPMNPQAHLDIAQGLLEEKRCRWVISNDAPRESNSFDRYIDEHFVVKRRFKYATILERAETGTK